MIDRNQIIKQADDDRVPAATVDPAADRYVGPLGRPRRLKLDLADDELVENTTRRPVFRRYGDQGEGDCLAYTLEETAAEKLRCVIQRLQ